MAQKMAQSHAMPRELRRLGKGDYELRGTQLRIVQGDDGKWTVTGHSDDLGSFASRGAAFGKLRELGVVPAEQPKPTQQPEQPQAEEAKQQPVLDPTDANGASGANGATGEAKRRPRKPRAKVAAKV
jgi:hypothetical protein